MGQYWKLINIDRKLTMRTRCMKLGEILFGSDPTQLVWLLAVPRKPPPYDRSVEKGHSTDTQDLGTLNLHTDILELIFKEFEAKDVGAVVSLSLTNTYLREIGQKRVWELLFSFHAPWWLQRLICVGDYLDGDDLPANIFRGEEEVKTLAGNDSQGARLYEAVGWKCFDGGILQRMWSTLSYRAYAGRPSAKERHMINEMVNPDFSWDGRPETEWILCNWTKAEYVHASAVAELTGTQCRGPWTSDSLSLGHVLITQICWSADASAAMCYDGPITRGPWAGHYFGITTVDNLLQDHNCVNKQPWTDVTERIVKEVLEIWRVDCPQALSEHLRTADYKRHDIDVEE